MLVPTFVLLGVDVSCRVSPSDFIEGALDQASQGTPYGGGLSALLLAPVVAFRHKFFPKAPAQPMDIEAVLAELQAEGQFGPDSEFKGGVGGDALK